MAEGEGVGEGTEVGTNMGSGRVKMGGRGDEA